MGTVYKVVDKLADEECFTMSRVRKHSMGEGRQSDNRVAWGVLGPG